MEAMNISIFKRESPKKLEEPKIINTINTQTIERPTLIPTLGSTFSRT